MSGANAFLSGFTGGMGAVNQMYANKARQAESEQRLEWAKEDRAIQEKQRKKQQDLWHGSAMLHFGNEMKKQNRGEEWNAYVADRANKDPRIRDSLQRNVGYNEQKKISPKLGSMTSKGFVPQIDVVDGRTGKTLRSGPMTEQGFSDGSDAPVAIGNEDLIEMAGAFMGGEGSQLFHEMQMMSAGQSLPEKKAQWSVVIKDGIMLAVPNDGGEPKSLGTVPKGGGGSKILDSWITEDDIEITVEQTGDQIVRRELRPDGTTHATEYTGKWDEWRTESGGVADADSQFDAVWYGSGDGYQQALPGEGVLKPEYHAGAQSKTPDTQPQPSPAKESPPAKEPPEKEAAPPERSQPSGIPGSATEISPATRQRLQEITDSYKSRGASIVTSLKENLNERNARGMEILKTRTEQYHGGMQK